MQIIEKLSNMLIPECMDRFDFENDLTVYYQVGKIFPPPRFLYGLKRRGLLLLNPRISPPFWNKKISMFLPDINVWLALTFEVHYKHPAASAWFDAQVDGSCLFCRATQ